MTLINVLRSQNTFFIVFFNLKNCSIVALKVKFSNLLLNYNYNFKKKL